MRGTFGQMAKAGSCVVCTDAAGVVELLAEVGIAAANLQHRRRALYKTQTPFSNVAVIFVPVAF